MKARNIYILQILVMLSPLFFAACDSANPEIDIRLDTDYTEVLEALSSSQQSLINKITLIDEAVRKGLGENQSLLGLIQEALESTNGSMQEKLATIESLIKSGTTMETKLALAETALNSGLADSKRQQELLLTAVESLDGTLEEKFDEVESVMTSSNSQLETKLGFIDAAVKSGFASQAQAETLIMNALSSVGETLSEKMAAVKKAITSKTPGLSSKVTLIETAVSEGFATEAEQLELIRAAVSSLDGTAAQQLAAIESAITGGTSDLETKLALVEAAMSTDIATTDKALDLIKQAVESLDGTLDEKHAALGKAISGQATSVETKFGLIVSSLKEGLGDQKDAIESLQRALDSSLGTLDGNLQQTKEDILSQLSEIAGKLSTAELAGAFTDIVSAINSRTQTDAETLEAILEAVRKINKALEPVSFSLTVSLSAPGFKDAWTAGDSIFVFLSNVAAPKYLKMGFDGSEWGYKEKNGETDSAGCLGLNDASKGILTAVYLPFGSDCSISASGTSFVFSDTETPWYMTATLPYTVEDQTITGTLDLQVPDGYVQFFTEVVLNNSITVVELREPNLTPQGIASIAADGSIVHTSIAHGAPLKGHLIDGTKKGFVFGGILATAVRNVDTSYHFTLVKGGWKGEYYYRSVTTSLYRAGNSGRNLDLYPVSTWTPVTDYKPIDMGCDIQVADDEMHRVYWASRNLGATSEDRSGGEATYGNYYAWGETAPKTGYCWKTYKWSTPDSTGCTKYISSDGMSSLLPEDDAAHIVLGGIWQIPQNGAWSRLGETDNFVWTWKPENSEGCAGYVVTGKKAGYDGPDGPSLFFPAAGYYGTAWNGPVLEYGLIGKGSSSYYWSSRSASDGKKAYYMKNSGSGYDSYPRFYGMPVRPVTY